MRQVVLDIAMGLQPPFHEPFQMKQEVGDGFAPRLGQGLVHEDWVARPRTSRVTVLPLQREVFEDIAPLVDRPFKQEKCDGGAHAKLRLDSSAFGSPEN